MASDPSSAPRTSAHPVLWLMALAAILYLSLYPFADWALRRPSPWAWLFMGLPRFYSWGDMIVNVGAYAGFGYLTVRQFQQRLGLWGAVLVASVGGCLLSFSMESIQSYLPRRVPSLLDLITNGLGALLGAALVVALTYSPRLQRMRTRISRLVLGHESEHRHRRFAAVLLILWVAGQIVPQQLLMSVGPLSPWPGQDLLPPLPLVGALPAWAVTLASVLLTAATTLLPALLVMRCVETPRNQLALWLLLLVTAVGLRLGGALHIYVRTDRLLTDLPILAAGLALALVLCHPLARWPEGVQRRVALGVIALTVALAWLIPPEPALQPLLKKTMTTYMRLATPGFRGLLRTIACWWPLAALYFFAIEAPNSSAGRLRSAVDGDPAVR